MSNFDTKIPSVKCEICSKTYCNASSLAQHKKIHKNEKMYQCEFCSKRFTQKGNLKTHIYSHTNERPYKCDFCEKRFNQKSNLITHLFHAHNIKYIHNRTKNYDYVRQITSRNLNDPNLVFLSKPIQNNTLKKVLEKKSIPFVAFSPLQGDPVIFKLTFVEGHQALTAVSESEIKENSEIISIKNESPKPNEVYGNVVQMKIPVVARIIQRSRTRRLSSSTTLFKM